MDADASEQQGKWDQAEKDYRKILEQNPRYPGIHFRLARLILSKPNPAPDFAEQAKKELQQELEIDPANAGAEYVLGELARQAQDLPEAVKHFSKATELDPNFADAYLGLGMSLLAQKNYADAVAPLEKAVKLHLGTLQGTTAWRPHTRAPDARKMRSGSSPCSKRPREPHPDREPRPRSDEGLSRRRFLWTLAGAGASASLPRFAGCRAAYPFEEVPASTSHITWVHTAGKSPQKYLPETTGAGCAFPRLRQRRMDGHLSRQQRQVRLLQSRSAAAQCALPQQSRRHLYRRHREGRRRSGRLRQGVAVGDYDGDGFPDLYVTQYRTQHPVSQQRRRNFHRRDGESRRRRSRMGARARSGSIMTTTAGWICSSAASPTSAKRRTLCGVAYTGKR